MKTLRTTAGLAIVCACMVIPSLGCSTSENQTGASTSEIQQYIQDNPDKVATPADSPADEAAEFAAGNG